MSKAADLINQLRLVQTVRFLPEAGDIAALVRSQVFPDNLIGAIGNMVKSETYDQFDWKHQTLYVAFIGSARTETGSEWDIYLATRNVVGSEIFDDEQRAIAATKAKVAMDNQGTGQFGIAKNLAFGTIVPVVRGLAQPGSKWIRITTDSRATSDLNSFGPDTTEKRQ